MVEVGMQLRRDRKPDGAQTGMGCQAFTQVPQEVADASRPAWLCPVIWRIHAACDVFAHRLAVDAELTGDGGGAEPLPVQIQEHHELSKSNHRFAPSRQGSSFGDRAGYSPPS